MKQFNKVLIAALATLALCAPIAFADDDGNEVETRTATGLTHESAVLNAEIELDDNEWTEYFFQYGPKTTGHNYPLQSGTVRLPAGDDDDEVPVSIVVTNLSQLSSYQFRAVRREQFEPNSYDIGGKRYFATLKAPLGAPGATTGPASTPEPALGKTVVADVTEGTVLVKERGSAEFQPLASAESIPVDSVLDTSDGTVVLETSLGGGKSQSGKFRGGKFEVRQSRKGGGMTEIALRGGNFASCHSATKGRTMHRKGPKRQLWASDKGGRFKTSSKGSVATVRGTSWYTADRCDGTLTKVKHGAVMVRERGTGRSKLLKAGQSFLARFPR